MEYGREFDKILSAALGKSDIFAAVEKGIRDWTNQSCHTIGEINNRPHGRGRLFEELALRYFRAQGYSAWLLADVPSDVAQKLSITKRDMGIDIVVQRGNKYDAVQVKFRSDAKPVSWKCLSTFLALAARTGPWARCVVFTNTRGARWTGRKRKSDITIARGTLSSLDRFTWLRMLPSAPPNESAPVDEEQVRLARLSYFSQNSPSP